MVPGSLLATPSSRMAAKQCNDMNGSKNTLAAATAFKALFPMTVNMAELNGNEKYLRLGKKLPTNASNPKIIHNGDLMLYGDNAVVLFYKTFSTSYDYMRFGCIKAPTGLAAAVGSGSVTVTFELE